MNNKINLIVENYFSISNIKNKNNIIDNSSIKYIIQMETFKKEFKRYQAISLKNRYWILDKNVLFLYLKKESILYKFFRGLPDKDIIIYEFIFNNNEILCNYILLENDIYLNYNFLLFCKKSTLKINSIYIYYYDNYFNVVQEKIVNVPAVKFCMYNETNKFNCEISSISSNAIDERPKPYHIKLNNNYIVDKDFVDSIPYIYNFSIYNNNCVFINNFLIYDDITTYYYMLDKISEIIYLDKFNFNRTPYVYNSTVLDLILIYDKLNQMIYPDIAIEWNSKIKSNIKIYKRYNIDTGNFEQIKIDNL